MTAIEEVARPISLKPDDVLNLRSSHQKQLFHGYFKARWGFMDNFNQMYNEGLALLSNAHITVTLERMDRYMAIMRDTYYIGEKPNKGAILPQTFLVTYLDKEITMTVGQICRNWPVLSEPAFDQTVSKFSVVLDGEKIAVERLPEITKLESIK